VFHLYKLFFRALSIRRGTKFTPQSQHNEGKPNAAI